MSLFRADGWRGQSGGLKLDGYIPSHPLQGPWPEQMDPGSHAPDTWLSSCYLWLRVPPSSPVDPLDGVSFLWEY